VSKQDRRHRQGMHFVWNPLGNWGGLVTGKMGTPLRAFPRKDLFSPSLLLRAL
jgi:hypothetical protein